MAMWGVVGWFLWKLADRTTTVLEEWRKWSIVEPELEYENSHADHTYQ